MFEPSNTLGEELRQMKEEEMKIERAKKLKQ